jgi:nucleotide-binding universal stress UspA family protein
MFERILFATTASPTCDDAAKVAFDLANKYDSEKLFVFHVPGFPTRGYSQFVRDSRTGDEEQISPEYMDWIHEEMKNTYGDIMEGCENCEIVVRVGVPSTEILRMARENNVNLIVMGAHTRQEDVGATRFRKFSGSNMRKVAQKARCPVLIISRPCTTCFKLFSHIVFATDFSKPAGSAFQFALEAANDVGARLYLFHAVDISGFHSGKDVDQSQIEKKVEAAKQKMEEKYVSKMGDFDNYEIAIWEGVPYVEVLKYARDKQADLIVMAHHTKDVDPEEAELGSTVEQVVLRSACPVASVNRPDKL